jgi:hypothetical protein
MGVVLDCSIETTPTPGSSPGQALVLCSTASVPLPLKVRERSCYSVRYYEPHLAATLATCQSSFQPAEWRQLACASATINSQNPVTKARRRVVGKRLFCRVLVSDISLRFLPGYVTGRLPDGTSKLGAGLSAGRYHGHGGSPAGAEVFSADEHIRVCGQQTGRCSQHRRRICRQVQARRADSIVQLASMVLGRAYNQLQLGCARYCVCSLPNLKKTRLVRNFPTRRSGGKSAGNTP